MRHRKHKHQLGVKKEHRQALMANLTAALIRYGRIETTLAKAKALRPFVEKIITLAKRAKSAAPERAIYLRRLAIARIKDKDAVAILFNEKADEFVNRPGGYTRIYKLGNRVGDAAPMALIELISGDDEGYSKGRKSSKKSAPAKVEEKEEVIVEETEEEVEATAEAEETAPEEAEEDSEKA